MINLIITTGVSGAGKTTCLEVLEEAGYFVIDNIPAAVVPELINEIKRKPSKYSKVALSINIGSAKKVFEIITKEKDFNVEFVGLDCSVETLNERFRLSRRLHPLQAKGLTLEQAIKRDFDEIRNIRDLFTFYIDTSKITQADLRRYFYKNIIRDKGSEFIVTFVSFGYKKMVPQDIESVFDVRLLPNPYWVPELRELTGRDQKIIDFVLNNDITHEYLEKVIEYLRYYLTKLKEQNRKRAFIGIACSGGQHRSVVIADYLAKYFSKEFVTDVNHRDLVK